MKYRIRFIAVCAIFGAEMGAVAVQPKFLKKKSSWAHEMLAQMSLREKLGQLCVAAISHAEDGKEILASKTGMEFPVMHPRHVEYLVKNYHIGGIIFLRKQTIKQQVELTNRLQAVSRLPLLVVEDLEWGLSMRLEDGMRFPRNLTLGAMQNEELVYEMGKEVGRQCNVIGVHINLSPVVDINNNPANPVINDRSFGCDKEKVARLGVLYMQGLQDAGILACAKHFPGHGDTEIDSHVALPTIAHEQKRLFEQELYPFKKIIDAGVAAVMNAHLQVPAYDAQNISTISYPIVTDLLQKKLGFSGLILTDALNMGALKKHKPGEIALQAVLAGNDMLLMPLDIAKTITYLEQAVLDGRLSEQELDAKVLKILKAKEYLQLNEKRLVAPEKLDERLHTVHVHELKKRLYAEAITLVRDKKSLIPCLPERCTLMQIGGKQNSAFEQACSSHKPCLIDYLSAQMSRQTAQKKAETYRKGDRVVITLFDMQKLQQKNFGVSAGTLKFIEALAQRGVNIVLVLFGSPYSVKLFDKADAIVVAYEDDPDAQHAAAKIVLGKAQATGTLPVC